MKIVEILKLDNVGKLFIDNDGDVYKVIQNDNFLDIILWDTTESYLHLEESITSFLSLEGILNIELTPVQKTTNIGPEMSIIEIIKPQYVGCKCIDKHGDVYRIEDHKGYIGLVLESSLLLPSCINDNITELYPLEPLLTKTFRLINR